MKANVPRRRRRAKTDTARIASIRACAAHLADLRRAYGRPPPDVPLPSRLAVRLVCPIPEGSWCSSPAQMCAELAE